MTAFAMHKTNGKHKNYNDPNATPQKRWDDCLPLPALSPVVTRLILFVVSIVCFVVSYDGDFVFDDSEAIVGNKDLQPERPITDLLYHDFWGNKLTNKSHKSYRPLTVLTYRWNYWLAGGLHPLGFHVVNIVLHGVVSVLFLSAFSSLLSGQGTSRTAGHDDEKASPVSKSAFFCSLLFAVHPVHTESVAGLVGRADLLCAVFFLLSFLAYVRACSDDENGSVYRPERVGWSWMLLSALCCFLATFSKEQGITVIGICCAYDIIIVSGVDPLKLIGLKSSASSSKQKAHQNGHNSHPEELSPWVKCLIQRQCVLVVSAFVFLLVRLQVMGLSPPTFQVPDNPHSFVNGSLYRGLNYNYLYAINGWLLLNPWWLCFDWSMGCIPTITSLADPRLVFVCVFWAFIGCLVFHTLSGELVHEKRCAMLGLAFLVGTFLPASNLLFRVGFVIAERNLYLPSAGFCILVTMGTVRLSSYRPLRQMVGVGVCLLCLVFIARCIHRSRHWRDELTLYSEGEKVCPLNGKVHYNIAKLRGDRGEVDFAINKYRLAIELNPEYDQAMNNLANILKDRGENLEAHSLLTRAVTINPEFAAAWMNLGIVQAQLKQYEAAESSYRTAILHRRKYPDCYYNLGNLYLEQKRHEDALAAWHNATILKPEHVNSWSNAIILLDNLGHQEQAVRMGEVALKILPDAAPLWFNIGNTQGKLERWADSERSFLNAIRLDPREARFHLNLGVLYHRWGKLDKAEQAYRKALERDPHNPSTQENLNMLERKRNNS
ncbi:protein O-mannosyl-transferase TMTC4-like [Littorina saxatilis]|uniref:dolichyl-phosphate-mannose--protein mannosyltransferase n=1 Tax=Littorina saxatilis TaxID=31220 RepID=A0AAN9G0P4_9CAEN